MKRKSEIEEHFVWKNRERNNREAFFMTGGLMVALLNIKVGNVLTGSVLLILIAVYFITPEKGEK